MFQEPHTYNRRVQKKNRIATVGKKSLCRSSWNHSTVVTLAPLWWVAPKLTCWIKFRVERFRALKRLGNWSEGKSSTVVEKKTEAHPHTHARALACPTSEEENWALSSIWERKNRFGAIQSAVTKVSKTDEKRSVRLRERARGRERERGRERIKKRKKGQSTRDQRCVNQYRNDERCATIWLAGWRGEEGKM